MQQLLLNLVPYLQALLKANQNELRSTNVTMQSDYMLSVWHGCGTMMLDARIHQQSNAININQPQLFPQGVDHGATMGILEPLDQGNCSLLSSFVQGLNIMIPPTPPNPEA